MPHLGLWRGEEHRIVLRHGINRRVKHAREELSGRKNRRMSHAPTWAMGSVGMVVRVRTAEGRLGIANEAFFIAVPSGLTTLRARYRRALAQIP